MERNLVLMCIEAATESSAAVEKWRRQRRTLQRMPSHLAESLLLRLLRRRLLFPSLLEVFKYSVEEIDLRGESYVDAEWMAYLGGFQHLRIMILADCNRINDSALWSITGLTSLKEVDLSRCSKITDAGIRHLSSIPALEKLWIPETAVTEDGIVLLASMTNLSVLDLGGLPVTNSALNSLQGLTKLRHLDLWGSQVSDEGAVVLEKFSSLSFLNVAWTRVTKLTKLPSMTCLNMSNCTINYLSNEKSHKALLEKLILSSTSIESGSEAFQHVETSSLHFLDLSSSSFHSFSILRSMNVLTHLDLSCTSIADDSIECVAYIGANLIYLNLSRTKITTDGIGGLAGCVSNLEIILLSGTSIDDGAILYISSMQALRVIDISSTEIKGLIHQATDDRNMVPSLSALQNLVHLESLNLEKLNIDSSALRPLSSFSRLSHLYLQNISLDDASLHRVSAVRNLIHLGFRDAVLTNYGLDAFFPPATLELLDLRGCWLLNEKAVSVFCQKHPRVELRQELFVINDRIVCQRSSPSRVTKSPPQSKPKQQKMSMAPLKYDGVFLDQRLKYSREELLAQQFSSASSSTSFHEGNLRAI